ncbi:MAG: hypothetical protein LQ350_002438 [Teloschistes chrysophthalmus]|nr:MAG: hypothetical protein LQ350_002438 [Niorma chrysophthalma]
MPSPYSPYVINESEPPTWMFGEENAASAFVGMIFLLVIEVNFEIFRAFSRRKGLYYWAITIGSWACALDALGIIFKYLTPGILRIWPLYTLCTTVGWAIYTVAQLTVLYSRLHLVSESRTIHRAVLAMILIGSPLIIIPDWVVVWAAWNPKPSITKKWSAPDAIVERYAQLGFDGMEITISGIYIFFLRKYLHIKSTVRRRRVMLDLIYVLGLVVTFDIVMVILVFLNRVGVSHPIQTFSYILKFRLELVVLNQLVAVAARGLRRETFEEKRYHGPDPPLIPSTYGIYGTAPQDFAAANLTGASKSSCDRHRGSIAESIGMLTPLSSAHARQASFPESRPSMVGSPRLTNDQRSQTRRSWYPIRFNLLEHKESGDKKIQSDTIKRHRRSSTIWYNDEDEPDEEEPLDLDMWQKRGSIRLQLPWISKRPNE